MLISSPSAGFPLDLQEIASDKRISQCFTLNFVKGGAILLILAAYLVLQDAPSKIEWTFGGPALAGGCALLAYDAMRRSRRRTLVVSGLQVAVYRGPHLEGAGNINEFVYRGSRFSLRQLFDNHFLLQLAVTSVEFGFFAALAAVRFLSIALFGHSIHDDAYSTRGRLFAILACMPSLWYLVNLVLSAYFRVEVAYRSAVPAEGFELLIARSSAGPFRPVMRGRGGSAGSCATPTRFRSQSAWSGRYRVYAGSTLTRERCQARRGFTPEKEGW